MAKKKLSRRTFIGTSAAAIAMSSAVGKTATAQRRRDTGPPKGEWWNWSGSVKCKPKVLATPGSESELLEVVGKALKKGQTIRVAGTGHSFVPVCASDGTLISLDGMQGIESVDAAKHQATILAGTKLDTLGAPLKAAGLSLINQGDIDKQALAGVVATGTHGTGATLTNLSAHVVKIRLITGTGDIVECSADREPEIFKAAQTALGSLGIMTHITMQCAPAYRLHERNWAVPFEQCMEELDDQIARNRSFEFFWGSRRDECLMKSLNITDNPSDESPAKGERLGYSGDIFPSQRTMKFNETEFSLPAENGPACLRELRDLMMGKHREIGWPLEYRTVAADDVYLSPHSGRPSVTISAHQSNRLKHEAFFADVQAIFLNHRGRPHWGKMHTLGADQLRGMYPEWEAFQAVRKELDPEGAFANDFVRDVLG